MDPSSGAPGTTPESEAVTGQLDPPENLTATEVMSTLRCSMSTVRALLSTGELPSFRIGGLRLVPRAALDALIAERMTTAATGGIRGEAARAS